MYCKEGGKSYVFEFKYGIGTNHTEMAGLAFNDLNRLSVIDVDKRYFIYVFNDKIASYYVNKYDSIFDINNPNKVYKIDSKCSIKKTGSFLKKSFSSFAIQYLDFSKFSYEIEKVIAKKIPNNNFNIVVYDVK